MLAILPEPVQARNGGHGGDNDLLAGLTDGDSDDKSAGTNEEANDASIGHLALAAALLALKCFVLGGAFGLACCCCCCSFCC